MPELPHGNVTGGRREAERLVGRPAPRFSAETVVSITPMLEASLQRLETVLAAG